MCSSDLYKTVNGKHICIEQEFIAGDQVDYENEEGESIDIDISKEQYQHYDMVNPALNHTGKGLIFTCPECQSHRLESCEEGPYNSEILHIDKDGDFDYGKIEADGSVDRFQCLDCGYILCGEDKQPIFINLEVVAWIKKYCTQSEQYIDSRYIDDNSGKFQNE